jgi:hypothetical protein
MRTKVLAIITITALFAIAASTVKKRKRPPSSGAKEKLSEWGFFQGKLSDLAPAKDVVPYDLNTPLFSDYTYKLRFIRIPADKKIILFGIDYLSVKKKGSADNRAHTELLSKGIAIFEGLDLSKVEEGEYFFIGLPLKFSGLDGSPVRAVLITL